jgi:hypothetical protein
MSRSSSLPARFFAKIRQGPQKADRGLLRGLYVGLVKINAEANSKLARHRFGDGWNTLSHAGTLQGQKALPQHPAGRSGQEVELDRSVK